MEKISLDKVNTAYRKIIDALRTMNAVAKEGESWGGDLFNPLYRMTVSEDKLKDVKEKIELFLQLNYSRMCKGVDLFRNVDYHSWFTVDDFEATAFVQKLHAAVGDNIDKIMLTEKRKVAGHLWRYESWDKTSKAPIPDQAVAEYVSDSTVSGRVWIEREKRTHSEIKKLHDESRYAINAFLWLAHFLAQPQLGADSPSAFKCWQSLGHTVPVPLTINCVPGSGPITGFTVYANGNVKFRFKRPDQAKRVVRVIFGSPVDLVWIKTEIDPESIFRQEFCEPKRVVRICREATA